MQLSKRPSDKSFTLCRPKVQTDVMQFTAIDAVAVNSWAKVDSF
jgi:hypothetical protein